MTEIIRSDAPRRSAMAGLAIGGLAVAILWLTATVIIIAWQVSQGVTDENTDAALSVFLGVIFILLAVALDIYRREFMPDELIHKIRRPKIVPPRTFR